MTPSLLETPSTIPAVRHEPPFAGVAARLEKARTAIEERFLAGGAALMAVREIVGELLTALEGIASALGDDHARLTTQRLNQAVAELRQRVETERRRQAELSEIVAAGTSLTPLIRDMRDVLRHLGICAIETRIAGAGIGEFLSFADDIANFVRVSDQEVARFVSLVRDISERLSSVHADTGRSVAQVGETLPAVSTTLVEAVDTIDQRSRQLEKVAERAAALVRNVQGKVGTVLSALQVGDATRQRIEHIQSGMDLVEELAHGSPDGEMLVAAGHRLFTALLEALQHDFDQQTRHIVATIRSLSGDAAAILSLHDTLGRADRAGGVDPMQAVEAGIAATRQLMSGIDAAQKRSSEARDATGRLASQLLDDAGSIGNLRNVRDDIRCLAINASLRCARLGVRGRAVGAIAGEINAVGDRLGHTAEQVLDHLERIRLQVGRAFEEPEQSDIAGELDEVAQILRTVNTTTEDHVEVIRRQGGTVQDRIGRIAQDLDFGATLGETLSDCVRALRATSSTLSFDEHNPLIAQFTERQIGRYTMAAERDLHRSVLHGVISSTSLPNDSHTTHSAAEDVDDFLL